MTSPPRWPASYRALSTIAALIAAAASITALALALVAVPVAAQATLQLPPPRGHVNDFAGVVGAAEAARMETIARFVREQSGGEITIVTLPDLAGRDVAAVALQIGREWGVGAKAGIGDRARNAGVVVLLIPKESSTDGAGHASIMVGQGAEGFIPDAVAGDFRREASRYFAQRAYGEGLLLATARLAQRYSDEFRFSLDSVGVRAQPQPRGVRRSRDVSPFTALLVFAVVMVLLSSGRGRRSGCAPFLVGNLLGQAMGGHGRYHGGGDFGGFGGGGGGFGGFGGGGGFSGGGSSGSF